MKNKNYLFLWIVIGVFTAICGLMLVLYFKTFPKDLSTDSNAWGNFGDYLGSITGLLAFVGVLYSINISEKRANKAEEVSRDRYNEESERNIFFQLLDLHIKKAESVTWKLDNVEVSYIEAFKEYSIVLNKGFIMLLAYSYIKKYPREINDNEELIRIYDFEKNLFNLIESVYGCHFSDRLVCFDIHSNREIYKNYKKIQEKMDNDILATGPTLKVKESFFKNIDFNLSSTEMYIIIRKVSDSLYKDYGHILGHYFRNMFYVMDTISKFSNQKNYKELFRAQLSRYELVLALFNAVGSRSSLRMVELLEEFDVFKDVYPNDLFMLKKSDNPQQLIKDILNEYKNDEANKKLTKS